MASAVGLLGQLEREHVLAAIRAIDLGQPTSFSESIKFDLVYLGRRYPPKRVAGMALQLMTGQPFGPYAFKGGAESASFRALRRCGFTIVEKPTTSEPRPLVESLGEVLQLQKLYQSKNTAEMQRRGSIIRDEIPEQLRNMISLFEPIFSGSGYSCEIEGSDGVGRKNESPWVRIFDQELSPSATQGWYVVLHFSRLGDFLYSTVGCGATVFTRGSLVDVPATELALRVAWARNLGIESQFPVADFSDTPKLNGNHLSRQFERAIAFAKAYSIGTWDEAGFVSDMQLLCGLLAKIYDAERLGKDPVAGTVEDQLLVQLDLSMRPGRGKGQGRGLTKAEQTAVELHAMAASRRALEDAGFADIKDTSARSPYDFSARREGKEWFVETKGTTSVGSDVILLTANELKLHREHKGSTVLIILSEIQLNRSAFAPSAEGGKLEMLLPWDHEEWECAPTAYRAKRKMK